MRWIFSGGSDCKVSAYNAGDLGSIPGSGRSPGEEMATHSSILAWKFLRAEEAGRLQSIGSQESDTTQYCLSLSTITCHAEKLCLKNPMFHIIPCFDTISTTDIFHSHCRFAFFRILYSWNHIVCSLLRLTSSI